MENINNQFEGSENCRESWNVYVKIAVIKGIGSGDEKGKLLVSLRHDEFNRALLASNRHFSDNFSRSILAVAPRVQSRKYKPVRCLRVNSKLKTQSLRNFFSTKSMCRCFSFAFRSFRNLQSTDVVLEIAFCVRNLNRLRTTSAPTADSANTPSASQRRDNCFEVCTQILNFSDKKLACAKQGFPAALSARVSS